DFFTEQADQALDCDGAVLVLPYPSAAFTDAMLWQIEAELSFSMPGGYFIGPGDDGRAYFGGDGSYTRSVFETAYLEGVVVPGTPEHRTAFASDLDEWDICAAVIGPGFNHDVVLDQATRLIGSEPEPVGGVLIWRDLTAIRSLSR
ncbi:MAG: hypothetical protein ACRDP2_14320, partial [Nocardioidaceae bacterium]